MWLGVQSVTDPDTPHLTSESSHPLPPQRTPTSWALLLALLAFAAARLGGGGSRSSGFPGCHSVDREDAVELTALLVVKVRKGAMGPMHSAINATEARWLPLGIANALGREQPAEVAHALEQQVLKSRFNEPLVALKLREACAMCRWLSGGAIAAAWALTRPAIFEEDT